MCNDNTDWLLCLNSQLQLRGEILTKQLVQSSSIAWRALQCRPMVMQIPPSQYSARSAPSQQHQHSSWKMPWEAHSCLPTLLHGSGLFRLSLSSPQKNNSVLPCHPAWRVQHLQQSAPRRPKPGTWKWGDENCRVFFWNHSLRWLVALSMRGGLRGSFMCYRGWKGMEMLRVQE